MEWDRSPFSLTKGVGHAGTSKKDGGYMSGDERITELLDRNLQEVFGEGDAARRRAAIEEFYTDDCVLYVPDGAFVGHDALDNSPGIYVPRILILSVHRMESPKPYTTGESSHGARARRASRPSTPGSMLSLFARARSLRCTSFSIRNSHSSASAGHQTSARLVGLA